MSLGNRASGRGMEIVVRTVVSPHAHERFQRLQTLFGTLRARRMSQRSGSSPPDARTQKCQIRELNTQAISCANIARMAFSSSTGAAVCVVEAGRVISLSR